MMSYEEFIEEVRSCRAAIPALMGAAEMHNDCQFRKWRHHLTDLISQIETQGYRIRCDITSRRFGTYDPYVTSNPGRDVLLDWYRRELSDTANELDVLVESYAKYGEPQKITDTGPKEAELESPQKVTLQWLYRHVPAPL